MIKAIPSICALAVSVASPPALAHLPTDLVVDGESNVYFIDIFANSLMKVTPEGEATELADLRKVVKEERAHSLAFRDGRFYVGGYYEGRIWSVSLSGEVALYYPFPAAEPTGLEVLHADFDSVGALYVTEYHYSAAKGEQKYRLLKFPDPTARPTVLLELSEGSDDYLNLHFGNVFVAADGTAYASSDHRIWRLEGDRGLRIFAGGAESGATDGVGTEAHFSYPAGMCLDRQGNLLVAEQAGRIRKIAPDGAVSTLAGGARRGHLDGTFAEARFEKIFALTIGPKGRLHAVEYCSDEGQREYRLRTLANGEVTTLARIPTDGVFRK